MVNIFAFADEASGQIDGQIAAMRRNGLQGLEIRGVDGQNISDISIMLIFVRLQAIPSKSAIYLGKNDI